MINLLLPDKRREIRAEYRTRVLVIGAIMTLAVLAVGLVLSGTVYYAIGFKRIAAERLLAVPKDNERLAKYDSDAREINNAAKLLSMAKERGDPPVPLMPIIRIVLNLRPTGLRLTEVSFTRGPGQEADKPASPSDRLLLRGVAADRKSLLDFVNALKAKTEFNNVDSPIANIIKETNSDFTITVEVKK